MTGSEVLLTTTTATTDRVARPEDSGRYSLLVTREVEHVRAAQRLRHEWHTRQLGCSRACVVCP
jgi:hypothetical protein